jgi:hypothetical protein
MGKIKDPKTGAQVSQHPGPPWEGQDHGHLTKDFKYQVGLWHSLSGGILIFFPSRTQISRGN